MDKEIEERFIILEKKVSEMKEWENYLSKGGLLEQIMEQIADLQSKVKLYEATIVGGDFQWLEITKLKTILRENYKFRVKWCEKAFELDVNTGILMKDQITHLETQIKFYKGLLEKLDAPKEQTEKIEDCKHKNTSPSSDPLIWYVCHDCGAHLNQKFEVIPKRYHAMVNEVLEVDSRGEKPSKFLKMCVECEQEFATIEERYKHERDVHHLHHSKLPELKEGLSGVNYAYAIKCGASKATIEKTEPEKYQLKFRDIITDIIDIMGYCRGDGEVKEIEEYLVGIDKEYILTKRVRGATRKELIEEFQTDLDSLSPNIPYQYEPLRILKDKWEERIK